MRGWPVVVAALALLAFAPSAHAEITIGSDLSADPNHIIVFGTNGVTYAARNATAPYRAVIVRWRVRPGVESAPVRLRVLRPSTGFEVARSGPEPSPAPQTVSVYDDMRIPMAQGDQIALECCPGTSQGHFLYDPGTVSDIWFTAIGDGQPIPPATLAGVAFGPAFNADIEPDADGDVHGDESQDNCPATANPGQEDANGDGVGNACDADGDGVPDASDACPTRTGSQADGCPAPPPATPRVNTPPVVRFRTPASGTAVKATQAIELEVADDAGNPTVTLFDDDGEICALSGPPYSCTWRPTGADVGRATLLASAVDSDGRSTLGIVRVRVARFPADLTRRVRGRRVTGRLVLPAAVEKSLGCRGEVTVRRGRTTRTAALKRNCTYSVRLPRGRGRTRARFAGNSVVEPAT